ncbi:MAG: DUF484 family protein [Pseudomonadota bacterium]
MNPSDTGPAQESDALDESAVTRYLETHPDFFVQRDQLLMNLRIPNPRGEAVSLMDRQVALLRERNVENRRLIDDFKRNALRNEAIFHSVKALVLALVRSKDADAFYAALAVGLRDELGFSASLLYVSDTDRGAGRINDIAYRYPVREMPRFYVTHFEQQDTFMGPLRDDERAWLFPEDSSDGATPSSAAVIALDRSPLTFLALGHTESGYFNSQLDTTLLSLMTDVMALMLPRYRPTDV